MDVAHAAISLRDGGVVAYPTEAVWGLGCDPFDHAAVRRLLGLKRREEARGVILVASHLDQLDEIADWDALPVARVAGIRAGWPGPHTWVVPATARVPRWITGAHAGVALRISAHPVVAALCDAFGGALVSTSANTAGAPPPRTRDGIEAAIAAAVDGIVDGETGGLDAPTAIRDALTGEVLRG